MSEQIALPLNLLTVRLLRPGCKLLLVRKNGIMDLSVRNSLK